MNIKFTLLVAFVLASLNVTTSPLTLESHDIADDPVPQNEIEVIINDASHTTGDTYTINVYYLGMLYSSQTTDSVQTMVTAPTFWRGNLDIEVKKHPANARSTTNNINAPTLIIIAQEVRYPGLQTIIQFEQI